jgi:intracellular septation protein
VNFGILLAGILPVVIFTIIEEYYGTYWGLVAGIIFGGGEIIWEYRKDKKVSGITLFGNGMLFFLGGISIFTNEGIWFKLQPAIMEVVFALFLWGSLLLKKPIMDLMLQKQKLQVPEVIKVRMNAMTFRIGIFLFLHALLATWAALNWSTQAWAMLKGIGFTGSFIAYMFIEGLVLRRSVKSQLKNSTVPSVSGSITSTSSNNNI